MLVNAAREPEIVDLGHCLSAMGARISGLGSHEIDIEGVDELHGAEHRVLPDRIETGTYAIAAAIAGGEVELVDTRADLIGAVVPLLERIGAEITAHQSRHQRCAATACARSRSTWPPSRFRDFRPTCRRSSWR